MHGEMSYREQKIQEYQSISWKWKTWLDESEMIRIKSCVYREHESHPVKLPLFRYPGQVGRLKDVVMGFWVHVRASGLRNQRLIPVMRLWHVATVFTIGTSEATL